LVSIYVPHTEGIKRGPWSPMCGDLFFKKNKSKRINFLAAGGAGREQVSGFLGYGVVKVQGALRAGNRVGQFYYDRGGENCNCISVQFWGQKMVVSLLRDAWANH